MKEKRIKRDKDQYNQKAESRPKRQLNLFPPIVKN